MQSIEVIDLWLRNKLEVVVDLKRLSPHSTGELCAVKVARIVRRGLCLREGTRLPYNFAKLREGLSLKFDRCQIP